MADAADATDPPDDTRTDTNTDPDTDALAELSAKLCRELTQSEYDARHHTRRQAERMAEGEPVAALLAIADHADTLASGFTELMERDQSVGLRLGRAVGETFSQIRQLFADRIMDAERAYRATLLGTRHGLDLAALLAEVATRRGDDRLAALCRRHLAERTPIVERATLALRWFAAHPDIAMKPS